jgi:pimeloyl-ACP methyl ester carboxylesterase
VILVMHGGGGMHFQWCVANADIVAPQVRFTEAALRDGFAVFLLDSTDKVSDLEGRPCGKVWDDEVRPRANLDLPFIAEVARVIVPRLRPADSAEAIFLAGLSSGGFMTVRAATEYPGLFAAVAPVSAGDPFGWHRLCIAGATGRTTVHGYGVDNETGKRIDAVGSCRADAYPNERPWPASAGKMRPAVRRFLHRDDGILDPSCSDKLGAQLRRHGYAEAPPFEISATGRRGYGPHLFQDPYIRPILDFFAQASGRLHR